ncbi:MAG: type II toxin-antitoxin system PemK/MazF family toxin [Verrucomicrobia bacterium]|nr:type II toxin-antitoxin system PemK/MazF family toxin [Verrucomicrobiota bacterium]
MNPKRGEIWWVNLDPTRGREIKKHRPCIIISADWLNFKRSTPVVVPLSASPDSAPPIVVPVPSAGPSSVAVIDQVRAVDKGRFTHTTGRLSGNDLLLVESSLRQVLQL